ncbi:Transcriptional regulatory protein UhpA [Dickeya solani]|nr:Transcriptional regulatory protein UhpA [Dickeya solani]
MITLALIDDHLIVRSGFAQLLGLEPDMQVVGEFGSGREALAGLPGRGCKSVSAIFRCRTSPDWNCSANCRRAWR